APNHRCNCEPDQSDQERALASHEVAETAAQQEQPAKRQGVRGDDPLPIRVRGPKRRLRGGQGNAHDRGIQGNHQLGHRDDCEGGPSPGILAGHLPGVLAGGSLSAHADLSRLTPAKPAAAPSTAPNTTAIADTNMSGFTVMMK